MFHLREFRQGLTLVYLLAQRKQIFLDVLGGFSDKHGSKVALKSGRVQMTNTAQRLSSEVDKR